ncbi:MAG TPA: TIGR00300 family protein [Planctomycetota bacterium]|jgi:lysine-ketoglutarate reductase/saccharopine dehydrogenase-like protein (TIGR00300 family)
MPSDTIELRGHIIDNQILPKVLDQIIALRADYSIEEISIGHRRKDESYARVRIDAPDDLTLRQVIELITRAGATLAGTQEVVLAPAPANGVFPDDFYATTNLPTDILIGGKWLRVENAEMDCGIVLGRSKRKARALRMHRVRKGEPVVVGHEGIRVAPLPRPAEHRAFEFMGSTVSSEKPKLLVIREIARQMRATRTAGRKILFVGGPAIIHTGAGSHLALLIERGFVDVLFAGNALAAHDIESAIFGTSLGVSLESGLPVEHGHEHHLRAVNRVRAAGSIANAVKKKIITSGVMHTCVKKGVPFVLSGSIRDDGPLPDVITDMVQAQDAMRVYMPQIGLALMVGTTLLSVATGNMLPAMVKTVCVDINPAVVTKLSDRGTFQALGLVTDAELFLRTLTRELKLR